MFRNRVLEFVPLNNTGHNSCQLAVSELAIWYRNPLKYTCAFPLTVMTKNKYDFHALVINKENKRIQIYRSINYHG
ncbi:hypothetical protein HanXRQr2_Chr07g0302701 [Helianthus annuus]|uniref:Uncharacterized protein n=1 Tax=Helianthus annuus TaxID=4232 RepID=A0A9K3NGE5_HELAN|nr:hypothetical protein HanXRQr2_Chr07g0302701 [Helianthus annuus]KAJ0905351.1 hypothetical protein HanPSC8_Chr07g0292971 [Helianthus annuus]